MALIQPVEDGKIPKDTSTTSIITEMVKSLLFRICPFLEASWSFFCVGFSVLLAMKHSISQCIVAIVLGKRITALLVQPVLGQNK